MTSGITREYETNLFSFSGDRLEKGSLEGRQVNSWTPNYNHTGFIFTITSVAFSGIGLAAMIVSFFYNDSTKFDIRKFAIYLTLSSAPLSIAGWISEVVGVIKQKTPLWVANSNATLNFMGNYLAGMGSALCLITPLCSVIDKTHVSEIETCKNLEFYGSLMMLQLSLFYIPLTLLHVGVNRIFGENNHE